MMGFAAIGRMRGGQPGGARVWFRAGALALVGAGLCLALGGFAGQARPGDAYAEAGRQAQIRPDYRGVTLPPNIAPLNFVVDEEGAAYFVRLKAPSGKPIEVSSKTPAIVFPPGPWRRLLSANRGAALTLEIFVKSPNAWTRFEAVTNTVAPEPIDDYIVYRRIHPAHSLWRDMGIYQRNLQTFDEKTIIDNRDFKHGCVNCHAFRNNRTDTILLGTRSGDYGSAAILIEGTRASKIGTKFGYTAWHPSGQLAAFSVNRVHQTFHSAAAEIRDVFDVDSLMAYYRVDARAVRTAAPLSRKDRLETYPAWSPDGKALYFSSAPRTWTSSNTVPKELEQIRYDLVRASYDLANDRWGPLETILSAQETGQSIVLPRISPDGRWMLFTMCDYGCFPVFRPSSDLYLMDLEAGARTGQYTYRRLDINSDASESWHSWSSNGRWIAFSSKRLSHLFTRTFLAYMDTEGVVHKPILLPQKDPQFYDGCLWTFSVPELVVEPVRIRKEAIGRAIRRSADIPVDMPVTMATPTAGAGRDYTEALRE